MFNIAIRRTGSNTLSPLPFCYSPSSPLPIIFSLSTVLHGALGCEQLFYFCFPFVIPFLSSRRKLLVVLSICLPVMLAGMYLTADEQIKAYWYVNPITRLPDFLWEYCFIRSISHYTIKDFFFHGNILGSSIRRFISSFLSLCRRYT